MVSYLVKKKNKWRDINSVNVDSKTKATLKSLKRHLVTTFQALNNEQQGKFYLKFNKFLKFQSISKIYNTSKKFWSYSLEEYILWILYFWFIIYEILC